MKSLIHGIAGTTAMLIIASFWIATLVSELFMSYATVAAVKQTIVYGLLLLVPIMAATGGTGFILAQKRAGQLIDKKRKRMSIMGANALLVLIPTAFFLNNKANLGEFDTLFYTVQTLELLAGAAQFFLMCLNLRDGLKLKRYFYTTATKN